jgi:hypothetical protein
MKRRLIEVGGWIGAVMVILAYSLVSFQVIDASNWVYSLLNIVGGIGLIAVSIVKKAYQPVLINIFWICIAVLALAQNFIIH